MAGIGFSEPLKGLMVGDEGGLGARNVGPEGLQGPGNAKALALRCCIISLGRV